MARANASILSRIHFPRVPIPSNSCCSRYYPVQEIHCSPLSSFLPAGPAKAWNPASLRLHLFFNEIADGAVSSKFLLPCGFHDERDAMTLLRTLGSPRLLYYSCAHTRSFPALLRSNSTSLRSMPPKVRAARQQRVHCLALA